VTKKKSRVKNTDEQNPDGAEEEARLEEDGESTEKDNRIKVKINTNKETDDDITDDEQDSVAALEEALAAAEKENADINDRLLRAAADFDNHKKRLDRQWNGSTSHRLKPPGRNSTPIIIRPCPPNRQMMWKEILFWKNIRKAT